MSNSYRPGHALHGQSVLAVSFRSSWLRSLLFVLLVCSFSAFAQTQLKEPADKTDVGAAIKELSNATQSESAVRAAADPVQSQQLIRIIPFGRTSPSASGIKSQAPAGAHLTYFGGPVISNIQVVVVFWGTNVVTTSAADGTANLSQFYTDITTSRYFDLLTEYTTAGVTGPDNVSTSNQTIGHGTFAGAVTITPSLCPGPTACTVTDALIQAELTNQINAGHLPAPQSDIHGIVKTYYAVYFPPNVTIQLDPITKSCVSGGFCAYHSNTGSNIPYGVMPDFSSGGCSLGCGAGTVFQRATGVSSHEMAEAITDAQVGSATVFGPPLGWYDNPPNLGEIADLCDPFDVSVNAGSNTYTVELLFSNVQNGCFSAPPVLNMPGPPGGAGPNLPFNLTLTIQSSVPNFVGPLSGYRGTVHFTSSDPGAVLPADYTFTAADAGAHTFSFTLTVLGNQTITVTDIHSSGFTGTTTINVNTTPDMGITKTHTGNFGLGQTGVYTITASNVGGGPTSGTVTVVDTLPIGLTATSMSGTGWSCTLNTVTCTRSDSLATGASYPPISVTVNIGSASSQVTNVATVSGGGETDTANDFVGDVTKIVNPGVDLGLSSSPFQLFTSQGATGVSFSTSIFNFGSVATTGAVTETITLVPGLTATAIAGTGWNCTLASLTCTRSDPLASNQGYPDIVVTFSVALNAPLSVNSITATVSDIGDTAPGNNTISITTEINAFLTIFSGGAPVTVNAGQPAQYLLGVAATAAAGTVTFSCSGLPAASSCTFAPPSLTNNSTTVVMTVSTTAHSTVVTGWHPDNRNPWPLLGLFALAAMTSLTLKLHATPRRLRRLVPILGACVLLVAGILVGCGGGGGGSTTTTVTNTITGTPAGTYTLTFIANSPNGSVNRQMTLTIR